MAVDLETLTDTCNSCHGANGVSQWLDMPTIAGISPFVHADALYFFRDNARPCETSEFRTGDTDRAATDMCAVAAELTDDEVEAIAEHYGALSFVPSKQNFDPARATAGKLVHDRDCEICHADGGRDAADDAGILGGQQREYLERSMREYRVGAREQPDKMAAKIDALGAGDIDALLHYYASLQ